MYLCIDFDKNESELTTKVRSLESINLDYDLFGVKKHLTINDCKLGVVGYMNQDSDMLEMEIFTKYREFFDNKKCEVGIVEQTNEEDDNNQRFYITFESEEHFRRKIPYLQLVLKLKKEDYSLITYKLNKNYEKFQINLKISDYTDDDKKFTKFMSGEDSNFIEQFELTAFTKFLFMNELNSFIERSFDD